MKTRNYDIFVVKIYDYALIDSFWGFPGLIDSLTSYATPITDDIFTYNLSGPKMSHHPLWQLQAGGYAFKQNNVIHFFSLLRFDIPI